MGVIAFPQKRLWLVDLSSCIMGNEVHFTARILRLHFIVINTRIKQLTSLKISWRLPDASTGFSLLRDKTKMQSFLLHGPLNASIIQLWLCLLISHWCFSGQRLGAESGFIPLPWSHIHKYICRHLTDGLTHTINTKLVCWNIAFLETRNNKTIPWFGRQ